MASTADRIRRAINVRNYRKGTGMSAKRNEELQDRLLENRGTKNRALQQDLVDYDRYNSSKKREAIPYERQREMGVRELKNPKGPVVSKEEAWNKARKNRKKGR